MNLKKSPVQSHPPEAMLFDLDGTLIDTLPLHLAAERRALADYGIEKIADDHPQTFGAGILPGMAMLAEHYDIDDLQAFTAHYLALWNAEVDKNLSPTPGAVEFPTAVAASETKIALVTSGDRPYADQVMANLGITALFNVVVTFQAVANPKPAPDAYQLACEQLDIAPEQTIAFEDSASGFNSLAAAGIESIAIGHEPVDRPAECASLSHHKDFTTLRINELSDHRDSSR